MLWPAMQAQLPVDPEVDMEKAMVLWTPQIASCDSEMADGEIQAEQTVEDTDLLNLQTLSLHYPPLTPDRPPIITISASQLALDIEMDNDAWPRDLYEYRGDSSRDIVPYSSPPRYEHEEVGDFSSLPSSPPEYLTGRPQYPHQYSGEGAGGDEEEGEQGEEESYEVAHGYSHHAYEGDQPYLIDHDQDPVSQQYYAYDNEPFSSQLPVSDNLCEPPSQLYDQEDYPDSEDDQDQYHHHHQQRYEHQYQHDEEGHQPDEVAHSVKRKYDEYDEHFDLRDDAVHDTYTHPQQGSKEKKKEHKKQKTFSAPAPAPPAPAPITPPPPPSDEEAQWQTGKIPGHQGSHSRRANSNESAGRKRAHGDSPTVEKVLKKPFRPPAPKIVLPKAQTQQPSSPAPAQQSAPSRAWLSRSAPAGRSPTRQEGPVPPASQDGQAFFDRMRDAQSSPINHKPKVTRAFKPPLLKPASSPASRPSASAGQKTESVATVIYKLEQEARTLRQAVKYHTDITEDERLVDLITQWRTAGRDVVEQMFDRVPKPDPTAQQALPHSSSSSSSWCFGDSAGNQHDQLNEEHQRFLELCAKNEDGEPIDDEGNPLLPQPEDLASMMQRACAPRLGESDDYIPMDRGGATSGTKAKAEAPKEWNMGTMMLRYQVDPALLGWDDDMEDWADVNESL